MSNNVNEKTYPLLADFFAGKTVALTGGTGFLGQAIIEKLLRCCPRVKKIILLIRKKKDVSPSQRLQDLAHSSVFNVLKEIQPNFAEKLDVVSCQLDAGGLGLDKRSKKILCREVNVFIHSAATLKFTEHLRLAYELNVKCVRRLMKLAKQMSFLQSFVHISTAYSNCDKVKTDEEFHDPGVNYLDLESSLRWMDDATCTKITPDILKKRPNTYTLTKALAEDVIKREGGRLPTCIVRPSMILPAIQEPMPGWGCNVYGPTAFIIGVHKGVIRSILAKKSVVADLIPVDLVVNGVLAAAMKTGCNFASQIKESICRHSSSSSCDSDIGSDSLKSFIDSSDSQDNLVFDSTSASSSSECDLLYEGKHKAYTCESNLNRTIPIYHLNTGTANPILIAELENLIRYWAFKLPCNPLRVPSFQVTTNRSLHSLVTLFGQTIPCHAIDAMNTLLNKRRRMVRMNNGILKGMDVMEFFFTNSFKFGNKNVVKLRQILQEKDRKEFYFDSKVIDWNDYFEAYVKGMRKYILKESTSDYDIQRKRLRNMAIMNNFINGAIVLGVFGMVAAYGVPVRKRGMLSSIWEKANTFNTMLV